jgi:hypothetical protein
MHYSDRNILKILCYVVAVPLGILAFKLLILSLPYLGILILSILIGTILVHYFKL